MLEEKNDNLSPIENETDGNQENVSQNDIQEVIEITESLGKMFDVKSHRFINRFKMGGVEFGFIDGYKIGVLDRPMT